MHSVQDSSRLVQLSKWRHLETPVLKVNQRQPSVELQLCRQADAESEASVPSRTPWHSPLTKHTGSGIVQLFSPKNKHNWAIYIYFSKLSLLARFFFLAGKQAAHKLKSQEATVRKTKTKKKQRWNSQTWDTVSADITAELNTVLKQLAVVGVLEEGEPVAPSLGLAEFKTSELIRGVGAADKDALSTFSFLEAFCTTVEGWKSRNPLVYFLNIF